jgi:hypothetical protein
MLIQASPTVRTGQRAQNVSELGATGHAELGVDPGKVVVDGANRDEQPLGDDPGRQPVGGQLRDLALAIRERHRPGASDEVRCGWRFATGG